MKTHTATTIANLTCGSVSYLALANDRLLYAGTTEGQTRVVYGDESGPVFSGFPVSLMAPHIEIVDGRPLYIARRNRKERVVHGIHEGNPYDRVAGLSFTSDGSIAYQAEDASDHFVVVNGVEGKRYPSVWMHTFAGGKALYTVDLYRLDRSTTGPKEWADMARERMVFGTEEGPICKAILKDRCRPIIAEGRAIYGVLHEDGACSIIDGDNIGRRYHSVSDLAPQLVNGSPLYIANERDETSRYGLRHLIVLGETEIVRHEGINYLSWVDGEPLYVAYDGGTSFLMHGSRRFDYDFHINPPRLVDGKPFFVGQTGGYAGDERPFGQFVVHGNAQGERFKRILSLDMIGGQPAYIASLPSDSYDDDGEEIPQVCFVHGTARGRIYTDIDDVTAAGDLPIYRATNDDGESCVVVGTDEGHFFDHIFSLNYDVARREVSYGAIKGRTVYRVTVKA